MPPISAVVPNLQGYSFETSPNLAATHMPRLFFLGLEDICLSDAISRRESQIEWGLPRQGHLRVPMSLLLIRQPHD